VKDAILLIHAQNVTNTNYFSMTTLLVLITSVIVLFLNIFNLRDYQFMIINPIIVENVTSINISTLKIRNVIIVVFYLMTVLLVDTLEIIMMMTTLIVFQYVLAVKVTKLSIQKVSARLLTFLTAINLILKMVTNAHFAMISTL